MEATESALDDSVSSELCCPFDLRRSISYAEAQTHPFLAEYYGISDEQHAEHWRHIDDEWLSVAGELALQLDRHTNNTSLVLAFELGSAGEGPILLFAADAQVGSWLSWRELKWRVGRRTVGVEESVTPHDAL